MKFDLAHVPFPEGYGEAILSLEDCKAHLSIAAEETEFDALIGVLRDASIEYVERLCQVKMGPVTGMVWRAEALPPGRGTAINLGVRPVSGIAAISWRDIEGSPVTGDADQFRVSGKGEVRPVIGGAWPGNVGGEVEITFAAGFAEGAAPLALIHAARLMLGHLFAHREAVIGGSVGGEVPLGVARLCDPYIPVLV